MLAIFPFKEKEEAVGLLPFLLILSDRRFSDEKHSEGVSSAVRRNGTTRAGDMYFIKASEGF